MPVDFFFFFFDARLTKTMIRQIINDERQYLSNSKCKQYIYHHILDALLKWPDLKLLYSLLIMTQDLSRLIKPLEIQMKLPCAKTHENKIRYYQHCVIQNNCLSVD